MPNRNRIILTTFGSFGDIHPYMAIAMELQRRGQQPVIATSELYREKIEGAGLAFAPVRPNIPPPDEQDQDLLERVMEPMSGAKVIMNEMLFPFVRDAYDDLLALVAGADLLVTHPLALAGPLVVEKTGIAWISSVLAPVSFMSAYDPPVPPFWQWMTRLYVLGPRFNKVSFDFIKRQYQSVPVDALRAELGLPAALGNSIFEGQHSPTRVMALFSQLFGAPQPDWPRQTRTTGFPFYDGRHADEMPTALVRFLDNGPPPIVFTLGTSAVWVARDFYRESIAATKLLGRRAVLLLGDDRNRPDTSLPPEIIAVNYAPFGALLARGCAMVHHGGVGTTSQGLRAGVPTLIVPFAFDQPDNAAHAARLGCSRTLRRDKYRAKRVAKELDILLGEADYAAKAAAVGQLIRSENGAATACDLIEEVLGRSPDTRESEDLVYASSH